MMVQYCFEEVSLHGLKSRPKFEVRAVPRRSVWCCLVGSGVKLVYPREPQLILLFCLAGSSSSPDFVRSEKLPQYQGACQRKASGHVGRKIEKFQSLTGGRGGIGTPDVLFPTVLYSRRVGACRLLQSTEILGIDTAEIGDSPPPQSSSLAIITFMISRSVSCASTTHQ